MYRHVRLDKNIPFYIGIGTKYSDKKSCQGIYSRAYEKKKCRNNYWKNIVNLTDYRIDILFETEDIEKIKVKEREFIALYKRHIDGGILCNMTLGGDGIGGVKIFSPESRKKISEFHKSRKRKRGYKLNRSKEGFLAISEAMKNRVVTEETRKKFSENLKGNKRGIGHSVSQEQREKTRERLKVKINKFSLSNELIFTYDSFMDADKDGFEARGIKRNIDGKTEVYKGFRWGYLNQRI